MAQGKIYEINGPVVKMKDAPDFTMLERVKVGKMGLIGEVIGIDGEFTVVQVYEPTSGLKPGETVSGTGVAMSAVLGPGMIGNIFDGIQRPLEKIEEKSGGGFIARGIDVENLNGDKKYDVTVIKKQGDKVFAGEIIATCAETALITHKSMVPPHISGEVVFAAENGSYTVYDTILTVKSENGVLYDIKLSQNWPIRTPRPYAVRRETNTLLVTGQRVIDTLFPIAKGGTAAVPGGFGTGKTMTQHQLAKWCDADIIVYIGCGERGNEMTQVLEEFSELIDPKTNRPLMDRTVLIANTSNMPVAAREASIYTGITIAEYYRDMGYHVAIMADSTSRWAEALREISGRLEEMPAEEGFPAYLPSRLSEFYERAGFVDTLSKNVGSVSVIGAVSPQGGDFSEPVTQNTKRFIRCFWALDKSLAYARHYPAINWLDSYTEYHDELENWYIENAGDKFLLYRGRIVSLLQEENQLMEIAKLVGSDVLPDDQRLVLEIAKVIRVGYLQQNAFHKVDTFVPIEKQYHMMDIILYLYEQFKKVVSRGIPLSHLTESGIFTKLINIKYDIDNENTAKFDEYKSEIDAICENLKKQYK